VMWSAQRKLVEELFAPCVRKRVKLQLLRYRSAHDDDGRAVIMIDGEEVWSMCDIVFMRIEYERREHSASLAREQGLTPMEAQRVENIQLASEGLLNVRGFHVALETFCNSSPEENLASTNVLIRSLAMFDRRVGKRRLQAIDIDSEHEKVRLFHALRCEAEGMVGVAGSENR